MPIQEKSGFCKISISVVVMGCVLLTGEIYAQAPYISASSYEALRMTTQSKRDAEIAAQARLKEFTYNGTTFKGEVMQVIPATVKIKSEDGRVGTFLVDNLNVEFAASLDMPNNPYKRLFTALGSPAAIESPAPVQPDRRSPEPMNTDSMAENQVGDVKVELVSVAIAPLEFKDMFGGRKVSAEDLLLVRLKITNTSTTKKMNYKTWRGGMMSLTKDFGSMSDEFGNFYKRIDTDTKTPLDSIERSDSIYPEKSITDTLVFEIPTDSAKTLTLDMPGDNIGQRQNVKFKISVQEINR